MIFENETLKHSGLYDKNNILENESLFPGIINTYGVSAFVMKSLEKIKHNASCGQLKTTLDNYTTECIASITRYQNESSITHPSIHETTGNMNFTLYAKTAYYKVLKEEEYLQKLINSLDREINHIE
ncbi:hypothetical protein [Chryseobacterium sp. LAM-KRS1]|uniref:hypothetical protein n=1 Tax=Chryseobacterium sp. LAM-KRS1 TaxID=2715754 RepID=UPI0015542076|nr:hypothetical protein [Chryseobacterium sp. LAM-KRS1]